MEQHTPQTGLLQAHLIRFGTGREVPGTGYAAFRIRARQYIMFGNYFCAFANIPTIQLCVIALATWQLFQCSRQHPYNPVARDCSRSYVRSPNSDYALK